MKRFIKSNATLAVALIGTTIALAGCGSSNSANPNGVGGVVTSPGYGAVGAIGAAGGSFGFSAANAYFSGPTLADQTPGFSPGQQQGDLQLGAVSLPGGPGTAGTLTGVTPYGSTLTVLTAQGSTNCPWGVGLCAQVTGVVNLSQQEMMAAGMQGGAPSVIAFGMSLQISGAEISGGYADVCVTRDQAGACHGIQMQFIPH